MGVVKNATYKVYNGTDFDELHFKTKAAQVICDNGKTIEASLKDIIDNTVKSSYLSDVDLNTLITNDNAYGNSGIFGIYNFRNGPNGAASDANVATIEVIRYSNDWLVQRLSYITTYGVQVYERARYSGTTWSPWQHIHTVYYDGTISSNQFNIFRNMLGVYAGGNLTDNHIMRLYRANGTMVGMVSLGANGDGLRVHLYDSTGAWQTYHDFGLDGCMLRKNTAIERLTGVVSNSYHIGASGNGRIESDTSVRIYNSARGSADSGLYIEPDGASGIKSYNTTRHRFNADGTKTGGTMEVEGTIYGMSPTDSPQTLIEYIDFDIVVAGTKEVFLDPIYNKMISKFTALLSNTDIKIKEKRANSIVLMGNGTTDIVFKGQRKEAQEYFRIMNGFNNQGYTEGGVI